MKLESYKSKDGADCVSLSLGLAVHFVLCSRWIGFKLIHNRYCEAVEFGPFRFARLFLNEFSTIR